MDAYKECKKSELCASVLCWPDYGGGYEIRYEGSWFCRFCDWGNEICILRNCKIPNPNVKKEVQSWNWRSSAVSDSGENSAECLRKATKNRFYSKRKAVKVIDEKEGEA